MESTVQAALAAEVHVGKGLQKVLVQDVCFAIVGLDRELAATSPLMRGRASSVPCPQDGHRDFHH